MQRLILSLALAVSLAAASQAAVPSTLNIQGILEDGTGTVVAAPPADLKFRLYNQSSGQSGGSHLWEEMHTTFGFDKGVFSVVLGSVTALPVAQFNQDLWLAVIADGTTEQMPLIKLSASAFALMAKAVENDAIGSMQILDGAIVATDLADDAVTSAKILDGTVAGADIGADQVVKSLNGLQDGVTILGGTGITVTVDGVNDEITIEAAGGGTLPIAEGGTGATSAAGARASLGVAVGVDVQAYDADLDDLADGSLSGGKVGSGINGGNITAGTVANARLTNGGALTVSPGNQLSGGGAVAPGGSTTLSVVEGSGSGLDADLVDGFNPSVSAGGSTIAVRDGNGRLQANDPVNSFDVATKLYVDSQSGGSVIKSIQRGVTVMSHGQTNIFASGVNQVDPNKAHLILLGSHAADGIGSFAVKIELKNNGSQIEISRHNAYSQGAISVSWVLVEYN